MGHLSVKGFEMEKVAGPTDVVSEIMKASGDLWKEPARWQSVL